MSRENGGDICRDLYTSHIWHHGKNLAHATIQTFLAEFQIELRNYWPLWNIYSLSPSILSKIVDMALESEVAELKRVHLKV